MNLALSALLLLSVGVNAFLAFRFYKSEKNPKAKTYDATALMSDLVRNGQAMVRIVRVAPEDVFLRSPRDL